MSLADLSKRMRDIDFAMLATQAENGRIAGRPMSNNGDVEYAGDSWFFTLESTAMVPQIARDPHVALFFQGSKGLLGKPPIYIAVEGRAELVRDKAAFAEHWVSDLERWFEQGVDTPGLVMIAVRATRIEYWDGEENGEIAV
jgi:general stress protein 26